MQCVNVNTSKEVEVCTKQDTTLSLSCPHGHVVFILSALYGYVDHCIPGLFCGSTKRVNADHVVRSQCQGKQTCQVAVNNAAFGDVCENLETASLNVRYKCDWPGE